MCESICPLAAISMKIDNDGFLFPAIDKKCNNCGICTKQCPAIETVKTIQNNGLSKFFAVSSKNQSVQKESSSGGAFTELAQYIIQEGGAVFGAAFTNNFKVEHVCSLTTEQLSLLRGSKYVQSHINNSYKQALVIAKQGKPVLFTGTPCQIAAMKKFLEVNGLNIEELYRFYLCDVICHGVASEKVFKNYLDFLSKMHNGKLIRYSFRNKRKGWKHFGSYAKFDNGTEYFRANYADTFMIGYLRNLQLRNSCYNCKFAKVPRDSDITLADFWGLPRNLYDKNGVSAVAINSDKGMKLFQKLDNINKTPVSMESVLRENPRLNNGKIQRPTEREEFFKALSRGDSYEAVAKKYLKQTFRIKVIMFIDRILLRILFPAKKSRRF